MPNQTRKYDDAFRMKAYDLFCEGKAPAEIAKELKIHRRALLRLKAQKWPELWEGGRAKRVAAKVQIVHDEAIEKFETVQARLQKTFRAVSNAAAAKLFRAANADTLPDDIALEAVVAAAEQEQKHDLPLADSLGPRSQQLAVGAFAKPTGEIGVVAALNQVFERVNGPDKPSTEGS